MRLPSRKAFTRTVTLLGTLPFAVSACTSKPDSLPQIATPPPQSLPTLNADSANKQNCQGQVIAIPARLQDQISQQYLSKYKLSRRIGILANRECFPKYNVTEKIEITAPGTSPIQIATGAAVEYDPKRKILPIPTLVESVYPIIPTLGKQADNDFYVQTNGIGENRFVPVTRTGINQQGKWQLQTKPYEKAECDQSSNQVRPQFIASTINRKFDWRNMLMPSAFAKAPSSSKPSSSKSPKGSDKGKRTVTAGGDDWPAFSSDTSERSCNLVTRQIPNPVSVPDDAAVLDAQGGLAATTEGSTQNSEFSTANPL